MKLISNFRKDVVFLIFWILLTLLTIIPSVAQDISYNYNYNDGKSKIVTDDFEINYNGKISLTDDEKDIKAISANGYFQVKKRSFGNSREIKISSDTQGNLKREFFIGGDLKPYNSEAQNWLGEILPEILNNTDFAMDDRIARNYTKNGITGVLNLISDIESDFMQKSYFIGVYKYKTYTINELIQIINQVTLTIDSDFERAEVMKFAAGYYLTDDNASSAYFNQAAMFDSDFERQNVLTNAISKQNLNNNQVIQILNASKKFDSGFECSNVLSQLIRADKINEKTLQPYLDVAGQIESDFERSNVIRPLFSIKNLLPSQIIGIFVTTISIESDYEKGNVLNDAIPLIAKNEDLIKSFINVVNTMDSDFEKSNLLTSLSNQNELINSGVVLIIRCAAGFDSDFEKANILSNIADKAKKAGDETVKEYRQAAKTINGDYEYGRVMRLID